MLLTDLQARSATQGTTSTVSSTTTTNEILNSILSSPPRTHRQSSPKTPRLTDSSENFTSPRSSRTGEGNNDFLERLKKSRDGFSNTNTSNYSGDASSSRNLEDEEIKSPPPVTEKPPELKITDFKTLFELAPLKKEVYEKEIQTEVEEEPHGSNWKRDSKEWKRDSKEWKRDSKEWKSSDKNSEKDVKLERKSSVEVLITKFSENKLTEPEQKKILSSPTFLTFFEKSSKFVERALNEKYDILVDYYENKNEKITPQSSLNLISTLSSPLTKTRSIMDLNWNPKYPELLLVAYSKPAFGIPGSDGLVIIWNLFLEKRPEAVLECQSQVTSATFSKFHPHIIIAGTSSGQIIQWDIRTKSSFTGGPTTHTSTASTTTNPTPPSSATTTTPTQTSLTTTITNHIKPIYPTLKSPLSANTHTDPVYSLNLVGTANAWNLVTASNDGLVCEWGRDFGGLPEHILNLNSETMEISTTCLIFPKNESTVFWIGTEEGSIYQGSRHVGPGSKAGIHQNDIYKGHSGMITNIDFHPRIPDLFLSCSVDWSVKLWRAKPKQSTQPTTTTPLTSFEESDDYVYDVKWAPQNPCVFGSVDGSGRFCVWDLSNDFEVPIISEVIGTGKPLNKLQWDKEGRKVLCGGLDGVVYVYDVGELAKSQDENEEWIRFQKTLLE
ncbi:hypothetical protein HK098_004183, partial [Nowakowskiella sp. JEL0407]